MDQVESINCHILAGEDLLPIDEDLYISITYDEGPVVAKSKVRGKSSQPVWDQWVSLGSPPITARSIYFSLQGSKTEEAHAYASLSLSQGMPGRHRLPLEPSPNSSNYKKLSKMQAGSLGYLVVEIGFVLKESPSDTPPERSTLSLGVADSQNILQEAAWKLTQQQQLPSPQQRSVQSTQPTYPSKINIEIIEARKLTKGDIFSSDPYVKGAWVSQPNKEAFKTHYVGSNLNPTWNSKHSLTVPKGERAMFLEVWDKDTFTDDFLGVTTLHLNKFGVQELQLEDRDRNRLSSILVVRLESADEGLYKTQVNDMSPTMSPTKPNPPPQQYQQQQQITNYQPQTIPSKPPQESLSANSLLVTVVRAWGLASTDMVTADPYVELTFEGQTKAIANTKVKECTLTPDFNETLKITVPVKPGGGYPDLVFTILDADMVGKDDFMGCTRLAVHKDMDGEHKLALQPRVGNKEDEKLAKKNNGLGYLLVNVVSNLRSVSPAVVPMKPPSPQPHNINQFRDTPSPPPKPTPPPPVNYYPPPPSPPPFIPPKYEEIHIPKPPPAPTGPLIRQTDYESVFVEVFEGYRLYRPTKSELPNCLVTLAFGREPHCAITRSIPFSKDPEWFESFQLNIPNQEAILVFRVIDISLGTHDLIGEGRVVLRGNCNGTHRLVLAKTGVPSTRDLGEIVVRVQALRRGEAWPHATSRSDFRGLDTSQESRTLTSIPTNIPEEEYHHHQALLWRQHVGPDRVIIAHPVSSEVKLSEDQKKRRAYEEYQRELEKLEQKAREFEKKQREVEASISRSIEGSAYLDTTLSKTSYVASTQIETTQTRAAIGTFSTIPTTLSASTVQSQSQNGTISTKTSTKVAKPAKYLSSHPLPPATISHQSKISTYKLPERERYDPEIEKIYQEAYEEAYQEAFINSLEQPSAAIQTIVNKPAAKRYQYGATGIPDGPRGRSKTPISHDQNISKTSAYNRSRSLSPNQAKVATGPKKTISKQQVQTKVSQEAYWKDQQEKRLLPTELRNIRDPRELANSKKKGAAFGSSTSKRFGPMPTSKYIDDFRGPVIQRI